MENMVDQKVAEKAAQFVLQMVTEGQFDGEDVRGILNEWKVAVQASETLNFAWALFQCGWDMAHEDCLRAIADAQQVVEIESRWEF